MCKSTLSNVLPPKKKQLRKTRVTKHFGCHKPKPKTEVLATLGTWKAWRHGVNQVPVPTVDTGENKKEMPQSIFNTSTLQVCDGLRPGKA